MENISDKWEDIPADKKEYMVAENWGVNGDCAFYLYYAEDVTDLLIQIVVFECGPGSIELLKRALVGCNTIDECLEMIARIECYMDWIVNVPLKILERTDEKTWKEIYYRDGNKK